MTMLEFVGLFTLLAVSIRLAWIFVNFLRASFIGNAIGLTLDPKKQGKWAVVTGATDGIGKGYAEELARRGMDVVLISRSLDKLQAVAKDISEKFKVETKVIAADFTKTDIYDGIAAELKKLDIGILINNVGMSYTYPEFLWKLDNPVEFSNRLINCNISSVINMTVAVLPQMVEKRKGIILNVSSASANFPTPFLTVYASSKAFVSKFSKDMAAECAPYNVTVQCVLPGFVATKMAGLKRSSLFVPTPAMYAAGSLNGLGLEVYSYGFWIHRIQYTVFELALAIARPLVERFNWYGFYAVRAKALHRMQKHGDPVGVTDTIFLKSSLFGGIEAVEKKNE